MSGGRTAELGILVTGTAGARGSEALAAALAACAADEHRTALLIEAAAERQRRPTLLASPAARECEAGLGGIAAAAARGLVCHLVTGPGEEGLALGAEALGRMPEPGPWVLHAEGEHWQGALGHPLLPAGAAVVRAELPRDRPLASLAVRDLRRRGLGVKVATRPLGWAAGRRALAGIRPGGSEEARLRRWLGLLLGAAR